MGDGNPTVRGRKMRTLTRTLLIANFALLFLSIGLGFSHEEY